jgi:hypothetical protein
VLTLLCDAYTVGIFSYHYRYRERKIKPDPHFTDAKNFRF